MKINNITSELKFVNRIGQTISIQERTNLQTSVQKLSCEYQYQYYEFWGRIEGILRNYFIVSGVKVKGQINFPVKKFFWSNEDFQFAELPQSRSEFIPQVKKMSDFFTGQHEKILLKVQQQQQSRVINHNGEQLVVKNKNMTQLDRLSIVVQLVEHDCRIVPVGAYKMIPTHQLVLNPHFNGLKINQAKNMENYAHFRAPILPHKQILIDCDQALERDDFMDPLTEDTIKKSWSIQTDQSGTQITVRSLVWEGYIGYHRTNSNIFGGIYMGLGIMAHDLPFIL